MVKSLYDRDKYTHAGVALWRPLINLQKGLFLFLKKKLLCLYLQPCILLKMFKNSLNYKLLCLKVFENIVFNYNSTVILNV